MNFSEMAEFVRAQADTDVTDAPDSTLQVYARAAYRDIQSRVFPWPNKKVNYDLTMISGTSTYSLSALTGGSDMKFVVTVYDSDDVLMFVTPERFNDLSVEGSSNGSPTVYTVTADQIKLWPTPNSASTLTVSGYRDFADWPSGSDSPDLPRGFDEVICWFMLSRYYKSQEDLELAADYLRDFEVGVQQQIQAAMRTSVVSAGPMIFGGDPNLYFGMSYDDWVKRGVEG